MLSRKETNKLAKAIYKDTIAAIETHSGECNVEANNDEYGYSWQDGEARILVEDECSSRFLESDQQSPDPSVEYVFRVRVELVAVVPTE